MLALVAAAAVGKWISHVLFFYFTNLRFHMLLYATEANVMPADANLWRKISVTEVFFQSKSTKIYIVDIKLCCAERMNPKTVFMHSTSCPRVWNIDMSMPMNYENLRNGKKEKKIIANKVEWQKCSAKIPLMYFICILLTLWPCEHKHHGMVQKVKHIHKSKCCNRAAKCTFMMIDACICIPFHAKKNQMRNSFNFPNKLHFIRAKWNFLHQTLRSTQIANWTKVQISAGFFFVRVNGL